MRASSTSLAAIVLLLSSAGACTGPSAPRDAGSADALSPDTGASVDASRDAPRSDAGGDVPTWVGTAHGTIKFRPSATLPTSRVVTIEAARNEWEPYQIVFSGGLDGRTITGLSASALSGPGGAPIPATQSFVYLEPFIRVPMPSSIEGASGLWPDPLVPLRDLIFDEARTVLPLTIPMFEVRVAWIDVLVPDDAAPGDYTGLIRVTSSDGDFDVPVQLHVFDFGLPSTPTLRTMFGGVGDAPCVAHHRGAWTGGAWDACADTDPAGDGDRLTEQYRQEYMQLALEYRISLGGSTYVGPHDATQLAHFDTVYAGLLDGTATHHLHGSHLTTLQVQYNRTPIATDTARTQLLVDHVTARGWDAIVFDYTEDEPESNGICPGTGSCPTITDRAAIVTAGGARSLVTAQFRYAQPHGFASAVQILVPILNDTRATSASFPSYQPVSEYASWLASSSRDLLWWYQSCESHGCGPTPDCGSATEDVRGYPSYVIDVDAVRARGMEWLTFTHGLTGELYFDTAFALDRAWDNPCSFGGAGDGTMFYPGRTDRIGGTHDVPLASIRMALVREGLEDYEYLHLLAMRGDMADAQRIASALVAEVDGLRDRTGDDVMAARHELALAIEAHP